MNGSRLTARTAGTESTANTTSVASMSTSTANSGVATRLAFRRVNSFWPSYSSVVGTILRTSAHRDVVVVVDLLVLVVAGDLHRGVEQERAEDVQHPLEVLDQRDAGEDEDGAQHEGAEDAPEEHPELVLAGTAKNEKITAQTNTLSIDRLFSIRKPA